ncbi:MAG: tripartite tricarboxylate transporter TctB family protein [Deltaproteobacteria bacterium]|nr:tripartite tricarboxylate transporter TctB family protein [Deltaproteobacteria bacterium]
MVTAKIVTRARAEGLVILLVALGYVWETRNIPTLFQSPGVPGPAAFPTVLGLVLGLAGLWRLVRGAPGDEAAARAAQKAAGEAKEPAAAGAPAPSWLAAHGRFYALWAVVLGFMFFMPELGFPLGAGAAMLLMFRLLGEKRWHVSAALSIATTAILYLGFSKGLGVRLPLGLLQGLLGK